MLSPARWSWCRSWSAGRLVDERQKHYRALRRREMQLERLSRRLELALDTSQIGVWEHEHRDRRAALGRPHERALRPPGRRQAARLSSIGSGSIHPDDSARAAGRFRPRRPRAWRRYQSEYRLLLPDGDAPPRARQRHASSRTSDGTPRIVGVELGRHADVMLNEDLERAKTLAEARNAELEAAKARIEHNALHDSLTGLPNRRYLDEMLAAHVARSSTRTASIGAAAYRPRPLQADQRHARPCRRRRHAGACRARAAAPTCATGDFVARIGGDEFVVLCRSNDGDADSSGRARRPHHRADAPAGDYQGHECRFGVSDRHRRRTRPRSPIRSGCWSMPTSRSTGPRAAAATATSSSPRRCRPRSSPPSGSPTRSCNGLERNEFVAYYQPQFDAATLEIVGVEALARWKHPTEGLLAPDAFLRIAEELNVVATIDRHDPRAGAREISTTGRPQGFDVPRVSVNVSARRLQDEDLIAQPARARHQAGHGVVRTGRVDLPRRERRAGHLEHRTDQGARHRHRDRRFRHRLRLDRQPAEAQAAPAEDRPPAGHADRRRRRRSGSWSDRSSTSASRWASRSWPKASRRWSMRAS